MQRSLVSLARHQRALLAAGQRVYASAAELAVAEESPFLRFASPEPAPVTYGSVLGQIPETSVILRVFPHSHAKNTPRPKEGCPIRVPLSYSHQIQL